MFGGIEEMMGGGPAGPGGPPGAPTAPPTGPPAPSVTSKPDGSNADNIRQAIELLNQYMNEEEDDEDLALVSKIQADLQKLLANNSKLADQAMGLGPGAKFIRKQTGGGGGAPGGGGGY